MRKPRTPGVLSLVLLAAGWFHHGGAHASGAAEPAPSPQPGKGWRYQVYAQDLPGVDNLAFGPDGALYATLELDNGQGKVVRILDGQATTVLEGLNRPDGLFVHGQLLYITEEVPYGRVLELDLSTGRLRTLAELYKPEGIGMLPDGDLVVSEDRVNGRLVRLRRGGGIEVVIGRLNRPEGLAVAKDGAIYFAETGTGRVLAYRNGELETVLNDLDEPDQVRFAPDGALWITEDARPGRLLRRKNGALEVVMTGLHLPQGIAFTGNGAVLVAEQGQRRILLIERAKGGKP
jgi:sugar lactone lactonase YvrE